MGPRPSRYTSTSLVEWEVADKDIMTRARNYRKRLQKTWEDVDFIEIVSDIQQYYLALDLKKSMAESTYTYINDFFENASDRNDVRPIIEAYTTPTSFSRLVNEDLAKMVNTNDLRDIRMSHDTPDDRCYWEGSLDIASILVNHPQLDCCRITREMTVYRGMVVPKSTLKNYAPRNRLMNKTFLSTSKLSITAGHFLGSHQDAGKIRCLCVFTLVPSARRTAIDVENLSHIPDEDEVLILPYSTFIVEDVQLEASTTLEKRYIIKLREWHESIDVD